ncbi:MAG: aminodeoxychorismate/anthranilate synthase component II [Saprospiraceae bacterium]|jgi:anthranilate synthase component 2|nr:aminodeoxychorismate/anthranilate synthase component II [Saprospiraceae bacterium]
MRVIILDNYDSFTFNLVHMVESITGDMPTVYKNDRCTLAQLQEASHIILSPGPGIPEEAGILKEAITSLSPTHRMLGVCLGFQAIGEVFGGTLRNLEQVFHGIQSEIHLIDPTDPLFAGISSPFLAGRYHSWVIEKESMSNGLIVSARDGNGEIMAGRHEVYQTYGVQFHPESIMTPQGVTMLRNFLSF